MSTKWYTYRPSAAVTNLVNDAPDVVKTAMVETSLKGEFVKDTVDSLQVDGEPQTDLKVFAARVTRSEVSDWSDMKERRTALFLALIRKSVGDEGFGVLLQARQDQFPSTPGVSSPKPEVETEEEAEKAEDTKMQVLSFAPRVKMQQVVEPEKQEENFTVDFGDNVDEAPEGTSAKDVLLDHRKWRLLDRMEQMELLRLLQTRYVAPREGDARDAGLAAIAIMDNAMRGKAVEFLLGMLLDDLLFFHFRFTEGLDSAKAFRQRSTLGDSTTPSRKAAIEAAQAKAKTLKRAAPTGWGHPEQKRARQDHGGSNFDRTWSGNKGFRGHRWQPPLPQKGGKGKGSQ